MVLAADKRQFPRVRYHCDVMVDDGLVTKGASLSAGGMFVYTMGIFRPQHAIKVSFPLYDGNLAVAGEVRHYQPGIGMGLMFMGTSGMHAELVQKYVDGVLRTQSMNRPKAVLLLDNNEYRRRLYRTALTHSHYQVVEAAAISQAFEILKSGCVGVVVFDPHVPGGLNIVKRMRINPAWHSIVPIVLSNRPVPEETRRRELPKVRHLFLQSTLPPMKLPEVIAQYIP